MKASLWICGLLGLAISGGAKAQAPAGATGQCKDGTYSTAASKSGACSGHKGVQAWYASTPAGASTQAAPNMQQKSPAVPATSSAPSSTAASAAPQSSPATKTSRTSPATMAQAPGGGPGMVWVNTKSKVYHCSGDTYYGKTKAGKYVSEEAAKAEGDRADNNKPCAK